jgi:hypothetical protein
MKFPTLVAWIAGLLCLLAGPAFAQATLSPTEPLELTRSGQFYLAEASEEPPDVDRLPTGWPARRRWRMSRCSAGATGSMRRCATAVRRRSG